jgi:OOP family OmpA-OmpF porin
MKPVQRLFVLWLLCTATISLFAKVENWDTFEEQHLLEVQPKLTNIIIIRPEELKGKAINIYIDGEYISSLLPGAYTEEKVCSGKHRVNIAYTNVYSRYKEKRKGGVWFEFKPASRQVFILSKENNILKINAYTKNDIQKLLKKYTKKQTHTISRFDKRKCTQPAAVK